MNIHSTYQGQKQSHSFDREAIVVGRANPFLAPDLDLYADIQVSRTHARIWLREGDYWIEDLASKHGTWVNGVRIDYRRQLYPGDSIQVGATVLEVDSPLPSERDGPLREPKPDTRVHAALDVEEFVAAPAQAVKVEAGGTDVMGSLAAELGSCERRAEATRLLAERIVQMFPRATRTAVLLRDAATGALAVAAAHPVGTQPVSEVMMLRALAEGRALLWRESLESLDVGGVHGQTGACGVYAPMFKRHQPVGVLCVEGEEPEPGFTETDLKRLLAAAGVAALALG